MNKLNTYACTHTHIHLHNFNIKIKGYWLHFQIIRCKHAMRECYLSYQICCQENLSHSLISFTSLIVFNVVVAVCFILYCLFLFSTSIYYTFISCSRSADERRRKNERKLSYSNLLYNISSMCQMSSI